MAGPERVNDGTITFRLAGLAGWERKGEALVKAYKFRDFAAAMEFVNRAADLAERANHHPELLIQFRTVTVTLSTHSAGGISDKDFDLAGQLDQPVPLPGGPVRR